MRFHFKIILFFAVCAGVGLMVGIFGGTKWMGGLNKQEVTVSDVVDEIKQAPYEPVTITFVGDIMMDRGVERSVERNFGGDFEKILALVAPALSVSDITFGNVEGPVTTKGPNVGSIYSFQMNPDIIPALQKTGFDIVSLANNHMGDRSIIGFTDTLANFSAKNFPYVGAGINKNQAKQPVIITVRDKKIGFLGFTDVGPDWMAARENTPGILLLSDPNLETIIKDAKSQVDVLIVSVHWGAEYVPATTRQKTFAHNMIDWGADTIIGHHPHVIQETEWYQGKFIAYSLGNFIFDQYFSDATLQGLVVDMNILENNQITVHQKVLEMSRQYQPTHLRDPLPADYVTSGRVSAQTCPSAVGAENDLWLTAVGPTTSIGNYIPKNLVPMNNRIDARGTATCLVEKAAEQLAKMFHDMEELGMKPVMTSGFRSKSVQEAVYKKSMGTSSGTSSVSTTPSVGQTDSNTTGEATNNDQELAAAIAEEQEHTSQTTTPTTYPSVAKPGHSEHQLGTAVDMKSATSANFSYDGFKNSDEYRWLVKNAHRYGFVQSYQPGKEPITGYIAEAWHWRYVGTDHAEKVKDGKVTLYEYLQGLSLR